MDVARPKFISKVRTTPVATRKSSCSGGWLRLMLQSIFAIITVTSFILIVIMSLKNPTPGAVVRPMVQMRCNLQSCRVICNKAPYYEDHETDILLSIMTAENQCNRIYLELHQPAFTNNTLPCNWLSRIRTDVSELAIFGGNLMKIPSGSFMSQFAGSIQTLQLLDLRIQSLEPNSLVGLSNLRTLTILNSRLEGVENNALQAVDDTLQTLTISKSGDWDPAVIAGFRGLERLTIVDFSYNVFNEILSIDSFVGLNVTKILYLNSCRILSIGPGTFDYLTSIEVLYLNDNLLITVPPGLFNVIVPLNNPRPRIHLQDNYWHCDCKVDDLRQLVRKEILLVEVICFSPEKFNSITFTEFDAMCTNKSSENDINNSSTNLISEDRKHNKKEQKFDYESIYVNRSSCENIISRSGSVLRVVSAVPSNKLCTPKKFQYANLSSFVEKRNNSPDVNRKWIQFSHLITTPSYSIVQINAISERDGFGLLWYQPACPQEINCLDVIPTNLKLYNTDPSARYTFCQVHLKNLTVDNDECFEVSGTGTEIYQFEKVTMIRLALYLGSMLLCCCFGAVAVYSLIRRKPTLLKGSKRIIFVKHKNIDALVMPPKMPLSDDFINPKDKDVFTLTAGNNDKLKPPTLQRMKSVRSDKSGSPSYISALQPTEDQLAEWRIRHHFNNDLTISSRKSEMSTVSWSDTTFYYSLDDSDRTYESFK